MKVVFASDGSPYSNESARVLNQLEFDGGLQLHLLTVSVDPFNTSPENLQPWRPEWEEQQKQFVAKHHAELKEKFRQRCPDPSMLHRHGDAAAEILNLANRIDADLIVMGAKGHSMIERVMLGSVSDYVATHAKCSVLVVRLQPDGAMEDHPIKKLAVAYDGSSAAREMLTELSHVKWDQDAEVSVVSVAKQFDYLMADEFSAAAVENEQDVLDAMQGNCDYAAKRVAEIIPHSDSTVVRGHHVGDTIVRTVEEKKSDLIILGDAGHSLIHDLILGNTTKFVLRHASCSVWISRHHRVVAKSNAKDEQAGVAT